MKLTDAETLKVLGIPKRHAVTFVRALWAVWLTTFMLWSFGTFASQGFPGYAKSQDVDLAVKESKAQTQQQSDRLNAILMLTLEPKIEAVYAEFCIETSGARRQALWSQYRGLQAQYVQVNPLHLEYVPTPCGH